MPLTTPLSSRYIVSPDVVLREEDPDAALVFNPDTDNIRVINHTGLFIWKLCDGAHSLESILAAMHDEFDGVPDDEVGQQVAGFLQGMVSAGFVGLIEG